MPAIAPHSDLIEEAIVLPSGLEMAFLRSAALDSDKPNVVFLHGWLDNAASFHFLVPYLSKDVNLWLLDLAGHGKSAWRQDRGGYNFFDYVDDFAQFIDKTQLCSLHLVGHSLGGLISTCYAAAFPAKVRALCLIESLTPLYESEENVVERLQNGIKSRHLLRKKPRRTLASLEQAIALRQRATPLPDNLLTPLISRATEAVEGGVVWRHDGLLKTDSLLRMSQAQVETVIRSIACPVTAILGESGYATLKQTQRQEWFSQLQLCTVPGGHHCHIESPKHVANAILAATGKVPF
uniref:alpha/beta fold hydrolase n=1 Tax=Thaumasiovibrio occultus TaxID=1891184 RepID=UPI000B3577E8|nr:alpha/beta hydrolase [Thaumasiovibrio occultus]